MSSYPWSVLGLEPTADERVIRRAYAARLKATNPEDDPAGFMALREAFEEARYQAEMGYLDLEPESEGDMAEPAAAPQSAGSSSDDPVQEARATQPAGQRDTILESANSVAAPETCAADPIPASDTSPPGDAHDHCAPDAPAESPEDDLRAAIARLQEQLWPERRKASIAANPWDTPESALEAVLNHPAMDAIDTYQRTEYTIGRMIQSSWPDHPTVARRATAFFGWDKSDYRGYRPHIRELYEDEQDQSIFTRVADRNHEYHAVYAFLKATPAPQSALWYLWSIWYGTRLFRFFADDSPEAELLRGGVPSATRDYWTGGGLKRLRLARFIPMVLLLLIVTLYILSI